MAYEERSAWVQAEAQPSLSGSAANWSEPLEPTNWTNSWTNWTNWTGAPTERPPPVGPLVYVAAGMSLMVLAVVSLVVNLMLLRSFCLIRALRPYLILNRSLVAADTFSLFFFALGLFIFTILDKFEMAPSAPCAILLIETLRMGGIMTTLCHLGALTAFHYTGILTPLEAHVWHTKRRAHYCTLLLWVAPTSLLLFYIFVLEGDGLDKCPHGFLSYQKFRIVFCAPFFTILGMMVIVYVHIYKSVNAQHLTGADRRLNCERSAKKYLMTSMIILGSTLVGWVPAFAYFALVCRDCLLSALYRRRTLDEFAILYVNNFLLILKTATNCFIYAMRIKEIEKPFMDMGCGFMLKWCGRSAHRRNESRERSRSSTKSSRVSSNSQKPTLVRVRSPNNAVQMAVFDDADGGHRIRRHRPNTTSV